MFSLFTKTKGTVYSLIQRLGIFRIPLLLLSLVLSADLFKYFLKLSGVNLKMPVSARVLAIRTELENIKSCGYPVSCLVVGGWALEGYPKLIANYLTANSKLLCVDAYSEKSDYGYKLSQQDKVNQKFASIAFQLAFINRTLIEQKNNVSVSLICSKNLVPIAEMYDLVFIDAGYQYNTYKAILSNSYMSLSDGGIIIGDDFELTLPLPKLLIEECSQNIDYDLIYSTTVKEYIHPGIVLGLYDFMSRFPNVKVEAKDGIFMIRKPICGSDACEYKSS